MNPMHGRPHSVTRQEKGQKLFEQGRVEESAFGWYVHSDSGTTYEVEQTFNGQALPYWCPCKDHERRPSIPCKHMTAVDLFRVSLNMLPWLESTPPKQVETVAEKIGRIKQLLDYAMTAETLDEREDFVLFAKQYSELMLKEVA
jgi:hypothetical protein